MSSVFTKIINRELSANIVYEDSENIAFMDISPVKKGHILVVPKLEIDNIFELPLDNYLSLFSFANFLARLSARTLKPRIIAFDASARIISDSFIAPAEDEIIFTMTSSVES